jgi:pyrimidine operon attenuation protein/uracil phosphoribosyltransferase
MWGGGWLLQQPTVAEQGTLAEKKRMLKVNEHMVTAAQDMLAAGRLADSAELQKLLQANLTELAIFVDQGARPAAPTTAQRALPPGTRS